MIIKTKKLLPVIILLILGQLIHAQQVKNPWEKWNYLIGEWVGEGNGQPGKGEGKFSFQTDLEGKILVRKNHTFFPATATSKDAIHDDLLIIYQPSSDGKEEAIYFDNEGHTIKYQVSFTEDVIVLTSTLSEGEMRFRLTYTKIDSKTAITSFEMAAPQTPEDFKMYLSGKVFKVK
jgi:hypothetical protein